MKNSLTIAVLVLCMAVTLPLRSERRRASAPPAGTLSIEFVDVPEQGAPLIAAGSDAWIDVRTISQQAGTGGKSVRVRRRFGIRIVRAGGASWGTAVVTARLDSPDGRSSVRINGQLLASTPVVVSARAAIGAVTVHLLEIEVANTVAEGPLAASISWEATTQ
jgi:hypothetical protein